jgi:hypothetical protein
VVGVELGNGHLVACRAQQEAKEKDESEGDKRREGIRGRRQAVGKNPGENGKQEGKGRKGQPDC